MTDVPALLEQLKLTRRKIRARAMLLRYHGTLRRLRYYAMFVCLPRTGHTLLASLLDAHSRMMFSSGLDAARYLCAGFDVWEMSVLSVWNSRRFTRHGRRSSGYDYTVPGGCHGRWEALEVVGDKSGDLFAARLAEDPTAMTRVFGALHVKARFLCVIRNPYDTITTMSLKDGVCLEDATAQYMRLWEATALARKAVPPEVWLDIRHESLVSDVRATLQSVLQFVGLTADEEYLECCTKLVFPRVRQTRETGNWPTRLIDQVSRWLERYPQFSSYSF